ncbi:MAG: hypothetical protein HGA65_19980, partial [Oscillochloris sp.]|nr:hypothetical protein [Oscillochloris sp.]
AVAGSFAAPWLLGHFRALLPRALHQPLQSVADALGIYATDWAAMLQAMGLSILVHLLWIAMHLICGLALAIAAPMLIYTLIVPLTDIVGLAPIFVNNLGAREMVFALYLGQLGVSEGSAVALAFTAFSVRLVVSATGGLLLLFDGRGPVSDEPDVHVGS